MKALLNTFGTYYKTHSMVTRYGSHDTEDAPATEDSPSLDLVPPEHSMPEGDNELSDEYCEETDTCHPLFELLEQSHQLKDQFVSLKSNTLQSTPRAVLPQLTDKLQHHTRMLKPAPSPVRNQCTKPCRPTWTPCTQHRENQTSPQPCS